MNERESLAPGRELCPECLSTRVMQIENSEPDSGYASILHGCLDCGTLWEPLPLGGTLYDDDGSPFPLLRPCDNCAFRKGSPENSDPQEWSKLVKSVEAGNPFYCHKGVPINFHNDIGFDYPHIGDKPDPHKNRMCRGALNVLFARAMEKLVIEGDSDIEPSGFIASEEG